MTTQATQKRRTQQRALDTRADILAAGAKLFSQNGFAATGVRDVAQEAGCNQALVSYYFKNKAGLYDAVLTEAIQGFVGAAGDVEAGQTSPVRDLVRGFARGLESDTHFARILVREYLHPDRLLDPERAAMLRQSMALTERMIASLPDGAKAKALDPQTVHLTVIGPLLLFHIATPVREAMAGKDPSVTVPTLGEFADQLADILEPALD